MNRRGIKVLSRCQGKAGEFKLTNRDQNIVVHGKQS